MNLQLEYFAVYSQETGDYCWKGMGPPGIASAQKVEMSMAVLEMPYEAYVALPDGGRPVTQEHLAPLKQAVVNLVNQKAGEFRKLHITDIPGQDATYLDKEREARAWIAAGSPAEATSADYPYLCREAIWTQQPIATVAQDVIATADQWRPMNALIEGRRRGAVTQVLAAQDMKAIVEAATFDWNALIQHPDASPADPPPTPGPLIPLIVDASQG